MNNVKSVKCNCTTGIATVTMKSGAKLTRRDVDSAFAGSRFAVSSFTAPKVTTNEQAELVVWKVSYTRGGG